MKNKDIIKNMFLALTATVILLSLTTPAIGIDNPTEPFQKAKALALLKGDATESRSGKIYILTIEQWGLIIYNTGKEDIWLRKGTSEENAGIGYRAGSGKYFVSRKKKGSEEEVTTTNWSAATKIAYKYLQEIETGER